MGKATGVFLVLAGLGTAALVLPSVDRGAEKQLADVVRIAMGNADIPSTQAPVPVLAQRPPASAPLITAATTTQPAAVAPTVVAAAPIGASSLSTGSTAKPVTLAASPVLVVPPRPVRPEQATAATQPSDLTKVIQKELKRVGCYDGEVSGEWSATTKKAMRSFIDRVNATLPVDQPDHILKMLVQGHPGNACGATCPTGQQIADNGRCLPSAILAQKPTLQPRRRDVASTATATDKPVQQAQKVDEQKSAVVKPTTAAASSWSTTTAAAVPNAAPLPGRMAIGGPREAVDAKPAPSTALSIPERALPQAALKPVPQKVAKAVDTDENDTPAVAAPVRNPDVKRSEPRAEPRVVERPVRVNRPSPPERVYRAPPPVRYAAPSYATSYSAAPRRFGPHIFSDQRWAR